MAPIAPQTVDIIFAGGGTAACVCAGRLAKANPNLRILLVEGGKNNFQDPSVTTPAVYLSHLTPESKTALVCYRFFPAFQSPVFPIVGAAIHFKLPVLRS